MSRLVRRLGWSLLLLWLVVTITFVLFRLIPGDPATLAAGPNASQQQIDSLRIEMGLDRPLPEQYVDYLGGVARLDFGVSVRTGEKVSSDIRKLLPATLELVCISFAIYVVLSIALGALTAMRRGRWPDRVIRVVSMLSAGVPVFWLGLLMQQVFFARVGLLPLGGRIDVRDVAPPEVTGFFTVDSLLAGDPRLFGTVLAHLVLPVTTTVLAILVVGVRATRSSILDELASPYVRTARAAGASERRVLSRHVLRNAVNPMISVSSLQFGYLLSWIVLIEAVFQWPGIGLYAFDSFQSLDYAPILGLTLVIGAFFIVANLIADLLYPVFGPRLREA
jgi:ABC-type dipeptide/oligopeptide/nickel transport system permease component